MEQIQNKDPHFKVSVLARTELPQRLTYGAMHQDYSEECVGDNWDQLTMSEDKAGEIIFKRLLAHQHFGPLEHAHITFSTGYFPHSVMQQARTHRVGVSFDVQSSRYTSERILNLANHIKDVDVRNDYMLCNMDIAKACQQEIEKIVYLRPPGFYTDRQGDRYEYTESHRDSDLNIVRGSVLHYHHNVVDNGFAEEHARGLIPFDIRQHFVVTFNIRSLMHFMDMRMPLDAQFEIRCLCDLMYPHFEEWVPDVAAWYTKNRKGKNKLAP